MKEITIQGIQVPSFIYGTAWKEENTKRLVEMAIKTGFRFIDTANQRRHYYEAAVGQALESLYQGKKVTREELFLQTKYTYVDGQDHRLPYDVNADHPAQVKQSFASSLEHLKTSYIDSYILHGPATRDALVDTDWQVWKTMTEIYQSGQIKLLGVSNVNYQQLASLVEEAEVKPHFVQNRCFAQLKWDKTIRELCEANGIKYQGFSLLTANRESLSHPLLEQLMKKYVRTSSQIVFRFALQLGMLPMTGTSNKMHMKEDFAIYDFELTDEEVDLLENIALE